VRTLFFILSVISMLCMGCAAMPDYQSGYVAMERGDLVTARYHFRKLAEMGLPEAQVGYGDILKADGREASLEQAETWYARAAEQNFRPAIGRLGRLYAGLVSMGRHEYADDAEHNLLLALDYGDYSGIRDLIELYFVIPERLSINRRQLRQLTDRIAKRDKAYADYAKVLYYHFSGEGRARAAEIIKLCQPLVKKMPGCYVEVARAWHASGDTQNLQAWILRIKQAYRSGELDAREVWQIAGWLADEGHSLAQPAMEMLQLVERNYPQATYARARLLYDNPALGSTEELLATLAQARARGSLHAELLTGRLYFEGKYVPADPVLAQKHLLNARVALPAADYFLGEMYYRGYFGKSDPQRGLEYLLSAARRGHAKADYALAEMFWVGRGNERNPVYALSFAALAAEEASAADSKPRELYRSISAAVSLAQQQQAERLRREEIQERKKAGVAEGPAILSLNQARN
jgi:alginate biosynthesis protein AlgK